MTRRGSGRDAYVYSTRFGELCPACERPIADCSCPASGASRGDGVVRVGRETKGRRGKGVTIVTGIPLAGAELARLAKELKRACGSGGTLRDGVLEIQGEHRDRLVTVLEAKGWSVKRSGG